MLTLRCGLAEHYKHCVVGIQIQGNDGSIVVLAIRGRLDHSTIGMPQLRCLPAYSKSCVNELSAIPPIVKEIYDPIYQLAMDEPDGCGTRATLQTAQIAGRQRSFKCRFDFMRVTHSQ